MSYEKKKKFIIDTIFYAVIAALCFFTVKYVIGWIIPFAVAFAVSAMVQPFASRFSADFRISRRFAACFSAFLFYGLVSVFAILICFGLYHALRNLFFSLPFIYENSVIPAFETITASLMQFFEKIDPALSAYLADFTGSFSANLGSTVSKISVNAVSRLSAHLAKIPYFIATAFISVIATFFVAADYDRIKTFIIRQIPPKWHLFLADIRDCTVKVVGKYIKCYALIMAVTFCELSIGLWLLGVKKFAVIAAVIAVFDIVPVCGSGGVLVPWAVFSIFSGRYTFGAGIFAIYGIITVIRQITEPRIVGGQIGLPPVVTLMAMFSGLHFMGVIGLFAFPVALVILKFLNDKGRIKLFR